MEEFMSKIRTIWLAKFVVISLDLNKLPPQKLNCLRLNDCVISRLEGRGRHIFIS